MIATPFDAVHTMRLRSRRQHNGCGWKSKEEGGYRPNQR